MPQKAPKKTTRKVTVASATARGVDPKRSAAAKRAAITRAKNRDAVVKKQLGLHHKLIAGGAVAAVLVFAFLGIRSQLESYAASTNSGSIIGLADKCFDNKRAGTANGNTIQLYPCNGSLAQQWVIDDGSLKANNGSTACLDVPKNTTAEKTYLRIYTCNGSPAQKFTLANGVLTNNTSGLCAMVKDGNSANMTRIWMMKCNGSEAQRWTYNAGLVADPIKPVSPTPIKPSPIKTPTPTPSPTPVSSTDIKSLVAKSSGQTLSLGATTYNVNNFGSDNMALSALKLKGINGAGKTATVIQLAPSSSTKAKSVPGQKSNYNPDATQTNPLYLLKVTGTPTLSNFTLKGTGQGHLYNGLRVHQTTNARISNILVTGIPGSDSVPPGETFGINDYRTKGSVYDSIEIDGSRVGASSFGANNSTNVTIVNSNFHDAKNGVGVTFWQSKDVTITGGQSVNNSNVGYNFERQSGTITVTGSKTTGNPWCDYRMASDKGSANYKIVDPIYSGKLKVCYKTTFNGHKNKQDKGAIHVIINGQDKTGSVVQWVG